MIRHRSFLPTSRSLVLTGLLGVVILTAGVVRADLVLQAGAPSYLLSTDGVTQTQVPIYLAQTGSTTILTTQGGINQFQVRVSPILPLVGDRPSLVAITPNPQFTGNSGGSLITGDMGGAFFDFVSGVPAIDGRVFLGTYSFTGSPTLPLVTTYQITAPSSGGYTFTAAGTELDGQINPGTFDLVIPEPAGLGLVGLAGAWMLRRRVRQ